MKIKRNYEKPTFGKIVLIGIKSFHSSKKSIKFNMYIVLKNSNNILLYRSIRKSTLTELDICNSKDSGTFPKTQ